MNTLTASQSRVVAFIRAFVKRNGYPPTRKEIAEKFGWASINSVVQQLGLIEKKGYIKLTPGISRGIVVL